MILFFCISAVNSWYYSLVYFLSIKPKDMQDKISDLPVFGDTIYSPELFSDPNEIRIR
jgi:hypothetical protein